MSVGYAQPVNLPEQILGLDRFRDIGIHTTSQATLFVALHSEGGQRGIGKAPNLW
jgi:hypothetical protein